MTQNFYLNTRNCKNTRKNSGLRVGEAKRFVRWDTCSSNYTKCLWNMEDSFDTSERLSYRYAIEYNFGFKIDI